MLKQIICKLRNITKDLTANVVPTGFFVGHDAFVGGQDCNPQAVDDTRHFFHTLVRTKTGTTYPS
jgi:hypothetical protein